MPERLGTDRARFGVTPPPLVAKCPAGPKSLDKFVT